MDTVGQASAVHAVEEPAVVGADLGRAGVVVLETGDGLAGFSGMDDGAGNSADVQEQAA